MGRHRHDPNIFTEGMKVLVYESQRNQEQPKIATVAQVRSRSIVLDNGDIYTLFGIEWGNSSSWNSRFIQPCTEEKLEQLKQAKVDRRRRTDRLLLTSKIELFIKDESITNERLQAVLDLLLS